MVCCGYVTYPQRMYTHALRVNTRSAPHIGCATGSCTTYRHFPSSVTHFLQYYFLLRYLPRAMDPSASFAAAGSASSGAKRHGRPPGSRNKPKVLALWMPGAGGPLRIGAPTQGAVNRAAPGTSMALTLRGPAPEGALNAPSPVAAAMQAPRPVGSIDRALREVEAALGPLPPVADAPGP
jgi:hypothetical protein